MKKVDENTVVYFEESVNKALEEGEVEKTERMSRIDEGFDMLEEAVTELLDEKHKALRNGFILGAGSVIGGLAVGFLGAALIDKYLR